jgi:hypothetical protein
MTSATGSPNHETQRTKRIELVIVPGRSFGPFHLGATLWDILQYFRDRPVFFPAVELKYSAEVLFILFSKKTMPILIITMRIGTFEIRLYHCTTCQRTQPPFR